MTFKRLKFSPSFESFVTDTELLIHSSHVYYDHIGSLNTPNDFKFMGVGTEISTHPQHDTFPEYLKGIRLLDVIVNHQVPVYVFRPIVGGHTQSDDFPMLVNDRGLLDLAINKYCPLASQ